jgi:hypothetical protein
LKIVRIGVFADDASKPQHLKLSHRKKYFEVGLWNVRGDLERSGHTHAFRLERFVPDKEVCWF